MALRIFFLAAALILSSVPLRAEPIRTSYKVVRTGALALMGFHYYLAHDCRSLGPVTINLVPPPQNGEVTIRSRTARPTFGSTSAFAACNRTKVQ